MMSFNYAVHAVLAVNFEGQARFSASTAAARKTHLL